MRSEIAITSLLLDYINETSHTNIPGPFTYRNELSSRCESVKLDTRRACAVKLSVNDNFKLLIVCVYMPCDPQLVNKVNVEYEEVLNCVEGLIQSTDCKGMLLCGDWNTSFERDNAQTKCLNEFMDRCNVKVAL